MNKKNDIFIMMNKKIESISLGKSSGMMLSDIIERENESLTVGMKFELSKKLLDAVRELHDNGILYLALHPDTIFVKVFSNLNRKVDEIILTDLSNLEKTDSANERRDYTLIDGYSSEELRIHSKYDKSVKIGELADIYSLTRICRFIFYENNRQEMICNDNEILNVLTDTFLHIGENTKPDYRFSSLAEMLSKLKILEEVNSSFLNDNYWFLFNIAYENELRSKQCELNFMSINEEQLSNGLNELHRILTKDKDIPRAAYVYRLFENLAERYKTQIPDIYFIQLYISGIRANNNIASPKKALKLYDKLQKLSLKPKDILEAYAPIATTYCNMLRFDESMKLLEDAINEFNSKNDYSDLSEDEIHQKYGRLYSSKATTMVLLDRNQEDIMHYFDLAVVSFGKISEEEKRNQEITMTYCRALLYACEIRDKELYEKYAELYFRGEDCISALRGYVLEWKKYSEVYQLYGLFAIIKGIYLFYISEPSFDEIYELISDLTENILIPENIGKNRLGYPLILIEYYLALIEYEVNGGINENVEIFFDNALSCTANVFSGETNLLTAIWYNVLYQYNKIRNRESDNIEIIERLKESCKSDGWQELYDILEEKKSLEGVLRYEWA